MMLFGLYFIKNNLDVNLGFQGGLANIQFLISTIQINFSLYLAYSEKSF
ncbi:hypothetical protein GIHI108528_07815 [Gillisia hiemivivida]